eukprot:3479470-Pleurochrysis_carterae.AAC.3
MQISCALCAHTPRTLRVRTPASGLEGLLDWAKSIYIFGFFTDEKVMRMPMLMLILVAVMMMVMIFIFSSGFSTLCFFSWLIVQTEELPPPAFP